MAIKGALPAHSFDFAKCGDDDDALNVVRSDWRRFGVWSQRISIRGGNTRFFLLSKVVADVIVARPQLGLTKRHKNYARLGGFKCQRSGGSPTGTDRLSRGRRRPKNPEGELFSSSTTTSPSNPTETTCFFGSSDRNPPLPPTVRLLLPYLVRQEAATAAVAAIRSAGPSCRIAAPCLPSRERNV